MLFSLANSHISTPLIKPNFINGSNPVQAWIFFWSPISLQVVLITAKIASIFMYKYIVPINSHAKRALIFFQAFFLLLLKYCSELQSTLPYSCPNYIVPMNSYAERNFQRNHEQEIPSWEETKQKIVKIQEKLLLLERAPNCQRFLLKTKPAAKPETLQIARQKNVYKQNPNPSRATIFSWLTYNQPWKNATSWLSFFGCTRKPHVENCSNIFEFFI